MMQTSPRPSISPLEQRQKRQRGCEPPPPPSSETHPVLDVINPDATKKKRDV